MLEINQVPYATEEFKQKIERAKKSSAWNTGLARRLWITSLVLVIVSLFLKSVSWQPFIFAAGIVVAFFMSMFYNFAWYWYNISFFELVEETAIRILRQIEEGFREYRLHAEQRRAYQTVDFDIVGARMKVAIDNVIALVNNPKAAIMRAEKIEEIKNEIRTLQSTSDESIPTVDEVDYSEMVLNFYSELANKLKTGEISRGVLIRIKDELVERIEKGLSANDNEQQIRQDFETRVAKGWAWSFAGVITWVFFAMLTIYGIVLMPNKWFVLGAYVFVAGSDFLLSKLMVRYLIARANKKAT